MNFICLIFLSVLFFLSSCGPEKGNITPTAPISTLEGKKPEQSPATMDPLTSPSPPPGKKNAEKNEKHEKKGILELIASKCLIAISPTNMAALPKFDEALCWPGNPDNYKLLPEIPQRVIDWASNGLGGKPWNFSDDQCNKFFTALQQRIADIYKNILQTPHDLFHAHIVGFAGKSLALIFHAKEYPQDLDKLKNHYQVKGEQFSSGDASFKNRNFIYLSSENPQIKSDIYLVNSQGPCRNIFAKDLNNTVSEDLVKDLVEGQKIGDVNIFYPNTLVRIKYNNYKIDDAHNEEKDTGKTLADRNDINTELDLWLKPLAHANLPIIFFMTKR